MLQLLSSSQNPDMLIKCHSLLC